eukprot:13284110-Heterocapsa_arctica.AAC.1
MSDLLTKAITGVRYAELKEVIGMRTDDEKIKDENDLVAMLSQHAPPTCDCGELIWIYVSANGLASWRC